MVLKHHVLTEGRTLESVISELKPDLDAKAEASRAREEASQRSRLAEMNVALALRVDIALGTDAQFALPRVV